MSLLKTVPAGAFVALIALSAAAQQRPATGAAARVAPAADGWGTYVGGSVGDSDFDTAFKAFVGQQFHPNLAWEAQVVNFGERRSGLVSELSAWSVGGSLVGLLPLSPDFSAFGKVGVHYVKTKVKVPGFSSSDTDVDLGIGIGGRYRINPQLSLRLELEDIGDGGDMISVGVQFRF